MRNKTIAIVSVFLMMFLLAFFVAPAAAAMPAMDSFAQDAKSGPEKAPPGEMKGGANYSGMYTFLKEGEFVQLTVEDDGQITGFISRFGEGGGDKGGFLDQFFKSAKLDGTKLSFTTQTVEGVWFEFKGKVERGAGKNPGEEAYYVLKGTLIENASDANKKVTAHSTDVALKMFPQEAQGAPEGN